MPMFREALKESQEFADDMVQPVKKMTNEGK